MTEVIYTRSRLRHVDSRNYADLAGTHCADKIIQSDQTLDKRASQRNNSELSAAPATSAELERLFRSLCEATETTNPRTFRLLQSGSRKIAQKLIEEAGEVAIEAVRHRTKSTVRESADLLYHLIVLWHRAGVKPEDVWEEMQSRADRFGIAEKLPKAPCDL